MAAASLATARTARGVQAAVGVLLVAVYSVLPASAQSVAYPLSTAVAVVAIVVGVWSYRPVTPAPWFLVAGAVACYLVGDLAFGAYALGHDGADPAFPSVSDVGYLAFYPLLFVALALFLRSRGRPDRASWVDAAIWAVGATALLWRPLLEPSLRAADGVGLPQLVATAYPLMDVALLVLVFVRLAGEPSSRSRAGVLLASSLLLQTAADVGYGIETLHGPHVSGDVLDLGWMAAYALVGAAALHPSMVRLTQPDHGPAETGGRARLIALLIPALIPPCLLIALATTGQPTRLDLGLYSVASIVVLLLAVMRGCDLIGVAERHAGDLQVRQQALEAALIDRDDFTAQLEVALRDNEHLISELRRRADHDTLTGLLSRDRFVAEIEAALRVAQDSGPRPSMAFLDIDDFKTVNDTLGHRAGDELLTMVADRITAVLQEDEIGARFGGDEFALLVLGDVQQAADRLLTVLRAPYVVAGNEIRVEVSIGVTTAHDLRCSPGDLLREGDIAMYAAKTAGGGWARYRTAMSAAVQHRLTMRAKLVQGIADDEIEAWFQPVVDLASGRLTGFESLARWCPRGQAPLAPDQWLIWAEENGLIATVDRRVLRAAVSQLADWRRRFGVDDLDLAVNMSGRTLQSSDIDQEVLDVLAERGVPPQRLVLEVTEGVLIDDDRIGVRLRRLRAAGVRIAFDDFGTGWSSLSNLRRLPVDTLKLDRSFTAELGRGPDGDAVPGAIIHLARSLSLGVVAEGVETADHRHRLLRLGFDDAQGFLFGAAQPARELDEVVSSRRAAEPYVLSPRPAVPLTIVR